MQEQARHEIDVPGRRGSWLRMAEPRLQAPVFERVRDELLAADMERFAALLDRALAPQLAYLTDSERQLYARGKKLRPAMLILAARMMLGEAEPSEKVIMAAVSLEMLHVATLIHDDIIDGALLRRGLKSVNATRGTNTAILVGDLQFLQAIRSFVSVIDTNSEMALVQHVLDTSFRIVCGELDELATDPSWSAEKLREHYFRVIERKTAVLFGVSCQSGVALAGGRTRDARRIGFYGRHVGRAFQIMDDLFDNLLDARAAGKAQGTDLSQRRFSLPIIYAMEELGPGHPVSRIARGELDPSPAELAEAVDAVRLSEGFARAYADARREALLGTEYLRFFPDNPYRQALSDIALAIADGCL